MSADGEYGGCGGPRCGTQVCCCWGMVGAITYEQSDLVNIRERYQICIVRTWAATLLIVQRAKFWLVCLLTSSLIFRKALIGGEVLYNCAECPHPDKPPTDETVCVDPATIGCWPALYQSKVTSFYNSPRCFFLDFRLKEKPWNFFCYLRSSISSAFRNLSTATSCIECRLPCKYSLS